MKKLLSMAMVLLMVAGGSSAALAKVKRGTLKGKKTGWQGANVPPGKNVSEAAKDKDKNKKK